MKLRTIIVEDEAPSLRRLKDLLLDFDDIELIAEVMDGPAALAVINTEQPDLVFLDIRLPGFSGFELLGKLSHKPMVIFVTAYDEYAIQAFEENAVDYLLKPTDRKRLSQAMEKVRKSHRIIDERLLAILQNVVLGEKYLDRFSVRKGDEILFFSAEDVYWFRADDKYVFLRTSNGEFFYTSTLKELEKNLDPDRFIRIHKSTIVAIDKIRKMKRTFTGTYKVYIDDEKKSGFEIGRTYIKTVRDKLHL